MIAAAALLSLLPSRADGYTYGAWSGFRRHPGALFNPDAEFQRIPSSDVCL